ncbi:MAG: glutamate-1-semialdehyde 2,1-aminomutase [Lachnospiraceae bacterium]
MGENKRSKELMQRAVACIPGGVNSPVRAYGAVHETPRFIERASGSHIFDVDGNEYIDYIDSWGPCILGHNHELIRENVIKACEKGLSFGCATETEVQMAEFITEHIPWIESVRMVNSGTEAVMSALRLARGYTGRDKIIKFAGCYHGHSDSMLVSAGSGVMVSGVPDSAGVTKGCTKDTMTAIYNDLSSVERLLEEAPGEVAAVILEPIGANMGVVLPQDGFLQGVRELCDRHNVLLIFDEVITGFRIGFTGAAGHFGVHPDLVTYGKIIGAGMPVGAYGGRKEIMEMVAPVGPVYQAGTLSGNPIAMTAGLTQLQLLWENSSVYLELTSKAQTLFEGMKEILTRHEYAYTLNYYASLGSLFFTESPVVEYQSAKTADTKAYADYFLYLLNHGIHLAPAQFEAMFLSAAHSSEDISKTLEIVDGYFKNL